MILLIDNYDSFAFNLYQLVGSVNPDIRVIRSDEMTVTEIEALAPSHIILSPGPGRGSERAPGLSAPRLSSLPCSAASSCPFSARGTWRCRR